MEFVGNSIGEKKLTGKDMNDPTRRNDLSNNPYEVPSVENG